MRRSTLIGLLTSMAGALFTFTPTAAQWLDVGKSEGYIPEEVEYPRTAAAAAITLIVFAAVTLFRFVSRLIGSSSGFEAAVGGEAVKQGIERKYEGVLKRPLPRGGSAESRSRIEVRELPATGRTINFVPSPAAKGRGLITARMRRNAIDEEIAAAAEERSELVIRQNDLLKDGHVVGELLESATVRLEAARKELRQAETDHEALTAQKRHNEKLRAEVTTRLSDLSAATAELSTEKATLV